MQNQISLKETALQLVFLLSLMTIFGLISVHMGQETGWDLQNYHFYDPYAFLHHRLSFDIAPAMLQTYFNPFLDIFNYSLMVTQKPAIVMFVLGTLSGITAFFVYKITFLILEKHWLSLFAMLIGMTGCAGIIQLGTTTNETKIACLLTLAIYCILKSLYSTQKRFYWVTLGGFLTGLTIGFKLTAATMGIGIIAGFIFIQPVSKQHFWAFVLLISSIGVGFLVSNGYWMWTLYQHFQNPFFPFYNTIFHSPYMGNENFSGSHFRSSDMMHYFFLPFYFFKSNMLATELPMRDPRLAITLTLIFLFLCFKCFALYRKKKEQLTPSSIRFLLITFIIAYLSWLIQFTIYRYAITLEILSGILMCYFTRYFIQNYRIQIGILGVLFLLMQWDTDYSNWGRIPVRDSFFIIQPVPQLSSHSLLILLGGDALAYMVPYIAPESRVMGVGNSIMAPTNQNKLQWEENKTINSFKGPIYSLTTQQYNTPSSVFLSYYALAQDKARCITLHTVIKDLLFCPLKHIDAQK